MVRKQSEGVYERFQRRYVGHQTGFKPELAERAQSAYRRPFLLPVITG